MKYIKKTATNTEDKLTINKRKKELSKILTIKYGTMGRIPIYKKQGTKTFCTYVIRPNLISLFAQITQTHWLQHEITIVITNTM